MLDPRFVALARLLARDLARHPPESELSPSPDDAYLTDSHPSSTEAAEGKRRG